MRLVVFVCLLLLPVVSSIGATISCPDEVYYDLEFVCDVHISESEGVYDLKVYIRGDSGGINRIWDGTDWQRADWYVKGLIESDGDYEVPLIIHKEFVGMASGAFKLRESGDSAILLEELFTIDIFGDVVVDEDEDNDEFDEDVVDEEESEDTTRNSERSVRNNNAGESQNVYLAPQPVSKNVPKKVINLNSQSDFKESQSIVYVSKNERIMNYFVYGFIVFLICIVGVLLYERRW